MNGLLRKGFCFLLSAALLVGCGGSGGGGGGGGTTPPATKAISIAIVDASGAGTTTITPQASGRVRATVTQGGAPVSGVNVSFVLNPVTVGVLSQATRATDASGVAEVQLLAGTVAGGTTVTATVDTITASKAVNIELPPTVNSLDLLSSKIDLASSGVDQVDLTAIVKDGNNVGVSGVSVQFAATSGSLAIVNAQTDASGNAKARLSTGGDKSNRSITVTGTTPGSSTLRDTVTINVTGTKVKVTAPPSLVLSKQATITLALLDSDNQGIADQVLSVVSARGNGLSNASPRTGSNGSVDIVYTASNSGDDTLTVTALGATASGSASISVSSDDFTLSKVAPAGDVWLANEDLSTADNDVAKMKVSWKKDGVAQTNKAVSVTTTRGILSASSLVTDANGDASFTVTSTNAGKALVTASGANPGEPSAQLEFEFVATKVAAISIDASTRSLAPNGQKANITATLRDAAGNLVKGKTINFGLNDVSGGTIFPASAITDSNGQASTVFTSGAVTAKDGVSITAAETSSGLNNVVKLTVAERSLFITLGTGNEIQKDAVSYTKQFLVFVTDANSAPRPNVTLNVSALPVARSTGLSAYLKGRYFFDPIVKIWFTAQGDNAAMPPVGCLNEDGNQNGFMDPAEDENGNGKLDPGNVVNVPGTVTTDASGKAIFDVHYPKTNGNWARIDLKVSTSVTGTESMANTVFVLPVAADDVNDEKKAPPGVPDGNAHISPFGKATVCTNPL